MILGFIRSLLELNRMRYHLPVLFLGLFLSGCVSIQDITGKAKYQTYLGDYQPGACLSPDEECADHSLSTRRPASGDRV